MRAPVPPRTPPAGLDTRYSTETEIMKRRLATIILVLLLPLSLLPACASGGGDKVEGVYLSSVSYFNQFGSTIDYQFYILYADGHAYNGVPPGEVETLDFAAAQAQDPKSVGAWVEKGGAVTITWGGGREPSVFPRKPDGSLDLKRGVSARLAALPDGQHIEGRYSRLAVASGLGGMVSSSRSLAFKADGSYAGAMVGAVAAAGAGGRAVERKDGGTYAIKGYTITFTTPDGATSKRLLASYAKEPPAAPEIIYLGGGYMLRD